MKPSGRQKSNRDRLVDLVSSSHKNVVMEIVNAVGQEGEEQSEIEFILDSTPGKLVAMKMGSIR